MKYVCPICGYIYDEAKEGTPFSELADSWLCPLCGALKSVFESEKKPDKAKITNAPVHMTSNMKKLSAGELSALFSNLARGCEKQYQKEAENLFNQLSDYFAAVTPDVQDADMEHLHELLQIDLNESYENVRSTASANADRGTLRICAWGEKVTNILNSIIQRYKKEGEDFLLNTDIWVCTTCGFVYVGASAPSLCPVCKVPAWKFEKIEGRVSV